MQIDEYGEVTLIDIMGSDQAIVDAAQMSYGRGTQKKSTPEGLINYLMRHRHTTPFEMVELKFYVKLPIHVARQWIRHRMANVNEYSSRYSIMADEFFEYFEGYSPQSTTNKQGRDEDFLDTHFVSRVRDHMAKGFEIYNEMIEDEISREQARNHLPLATYTQMVWKIDLHNLFHFLKLRMDSHAQKEIRTYAQAMYDQIQPLVPLACAAFENYSLHAYNVSRRELNILGQLLREFDPDFIRGAMKRAGVTDREVNEFLAAIS